MLRKRGLITGMTLTAMLLQASPSHARSPEVILEGIFTKIDGDTYRVNGIKVRDLYGRAPESNHPNEALNCMEGRIASEFLEKYNGEFVEVLSDSGEIYDYYGRLLGVIYVPKYDITITQEMLSEGMTRYKTNSNSHWYRDFSRAQKDAQFRGRGFWNKKTKKWNAPN